MYLSNLLYLKTIELCYYSCETMNPFHNPIFLSWILKTYLLEINRLRKLIEEKLKIGKLPIVSKEDIKNYYPDGIISSRTPKEKLISISTSGTTGKSLTIFSDMYDVVRWFFYLNLFP